MIEIRFYTDENVAKAVTLGLRLRGVEVMSAREAGLLGANDAAHMALALAESRVIFTQDDDFLGLSAHGHAHAGIVYAPQGTQIGHIVGGLMEIFHVLAAEEMIGRIEFH